MDDIKLPPLPDISAAYQQKAFHDYARAAVELNRKQDEVPWGPERDQVYWYNDSAGEQGSTYWRAHDTDRRRLAAHNVYRTEADAKQGALRDVAMRKLFATGLKLSPHMNMKQLVVHTHMNSTAAVWDCYEALTDAEREAIGGGR